jgi:acyl dehydratase
MATKLTYATRDDLIVGAERELAVGPLTRTNFVRFAGAIGDFNPNHHDELYAIRSGFDRPFAPGMLQGGYMGRLISEWVGPAALRTLRIRFASQAWPGDMVNCKATVINRTEDDGTVRIDIEAQATNQRGEVLIEAKASATLAN